MESIRNLYRIGTGPSSSHTMAPRRAAEYFRRDYPRAVGFRVALFGSLAATGRGHLIDVALQRAFDPMPVEILWWRVVPWAAGMSTVPEAAPWKTKTVHRKINRYIRRSTCRYRTDMRFLRRTAGHPALSEGNMGFQR